MAKKKPGEQVIVKIGCPECDKIFDNRIGLGVHLKRAHKKVKESKRGVGRPTIISEEVVKKIEEASAIDATIHELCLYANISVQTYYNWLDANPEYVERLKLLRNSPFLKARRSIVQSLEDPNNAFRYMEKKLPAEFSDRKVVQHEGIEGEVNINNALFIGAESLKNKYEKELADMYSQQATQELEETNDKK